MEIERKWLLKTLPLEPPKEKYWVEQFYLSLDPEIRVRRCIPNGEYENKVSYRMTIKGNGSLTREEIETPISKEFYEEVLDFSNTDPVQKHFLIYEVDSHQVEVNVVLSGEGFIYTEVEFPSVHDAISYSFPWPDLIEREVTDDPEYKMKNVWKRLNGETQSEQEL